MRRLMIDIPKPFSFGDRPLDKSAYWKIIFLITQPKHMLWVLKSHTLNMFQLMSKEKIAILGA